MLTRAARLLVLPVCGVGAISTEGLGLLVSVFSLALVSWGIVVDSMLGVFSESMVILGKVNDAITRRVEQAMKQGIWLDTDSPGEKSRG